MKCPSGVLRSVPISLPKFCTVNWKGRRGYCKPAPKVGSELNPFMEVVTFPGRSNTYTSSSPKREAVAEPAWSAVKERVLILASFDRLSPGSHSETRLLCQSGREAALLITSLPMDTAEPLLLLRVFAALYPAGCVLFQTEGQAAGSFITLLGSHFSLNRPSRILQGWIEFMRGTAMPEGTPWRNAI